MLLANTCTNNVKTFFSILAIIANTMGNTICKYIDLYVKSMFKIFKVAYLLSSMERSYLGQITWKVPCHLMTVYLQMIILIVIGN